VLAVLMFLMVFSEFLPPREFSSGRAINASLYLLAAVSFGFMSQSLGVYVRRLSFYHVRLDAQGVEFLFGTKKSPELVNMTWDQVNAVHHWRVVNEHHYKVTTTDGGYATFTSNTFFGAKKMARRIAAHAKVSILEE
jgi:hypothetical protein